MKKWKSHALIGMKAVESLPDWERKLLPDSLVTAARSIPFIPKFTNTAEEVLAAMCMVTDQVYLPDFRPYCLLPGGEWIPHTVPDGDGKAAFQSGQAPSQAKCAETIQCLMEKMSRTLETSDMLEMAFQGGTLGHFLQDAVAPSHAVSGQLLKDLFPDPVPGRQLSLGKWLYAVSDRFSPIPPLLAGCSIPEAACRLTWEVMKSLRRSRKILPLLMQAAYANAPLETCENLLIAQVRDAAWLTASAWHTVFSLQKKQSPNGQENLLPRVNLLEAEPYFMHPGKYQNLLPGRQIIDGSQKELLICQPDGNAQPAPANSFAMTGYSAIKFHIGTGIFSSFSCEAGITADWKQNANLIFSIESDAQENRCYSEELEYGATNLASVTLIPGAQPVKLNVDVTSARTLLLCARSFPIQDADGSPVFHIPDIAVCNAVLHKAPYYS